MTIGVLTVSIKLYRSHSLKDKRRVLLSVKSSLKSKFNVSVAEVGGASKDALDEATLAVAMVSDSAPHVDSSLSSVVKFMESSNDFYITEMFTERL